jgi:hypothetical protein
VDTPEAKEKVKELVPGFDFTTVPRSRTGKGWQLFFQHPGITIPNRAGVIPGLDVRGDGGYVVAPPSIHPNGKVYRWEVPINEYLPELPVELYRLISSPRPMVGTLSANDSTQCKLWPASRKVNAMKLFLADGQTLMTRLSLPSHRQRKLVREESI